MTQVVIVGCGVVGAAIAYELSQVEGLSVTVLDRQPPAQAATQAALGVLMGVISHKVKGRAWSLRTTSLQRYETWIPELEALTGQKLLFNRQGILMLCFAGEPWEPWQQLQKTRQAQGYQLHLLDREQVLQTYPQVQNSRVIGAVHSPQDRQLDPAALTLALVEAAKQRGVSFDFATEVQGFTTAEDQSVQQVQTNQGVLSADWFVLSAGLGSTPLLQSLKHPLEIKPVLGQALKVRLDQPLGSHQPVITGEDVHIVPLGAGDYWVGATVEIEAIDLVPDAERLEQVWQQAIALCPGLAQGTILHTWSGLRPRPVNRPAPVIEPLQGYRNVYLATGHYRNGILLAPATAVAVREAIASTGA